jgi:aerobic carbon-monoxide dehydrogenase small subunit
MNDEPCCAVALHVNGAAVRVQVPARRHLADVLREDLGLTGTHLGCEHGVCGACSVRVDGLVLRGCLLPAACAEGKAVETIEGAAQSGELAQLQAAFERRNAAQCGFCTPGMLLTAAELCREHPDADRETIRDYLSGNLCRCTGYQAIVDAVQDVLREQRGALR